MNIQRPLSLHRTTPLPTPPRPSLHRPTPTTLPPRPPRGALLPTSSMAAPPQIYERITATAKAKAALPLGKTFRMALLAGFYISFGGLLAMSTGGNVPALASSNPGLQKFFLGFSGLPFGLTMCLVCGAELFTGNVAIMTTAYLDGDVTLADTLKNWAVSFLGNFLAALILVKLIAATGLLAGAAAPAALAAAKISLSWKTAFFRGLLANWLVCIAVWMATAADDLVSKVAAVFIPITLFVAVGGEHSVANMFMVPMGLVGGSTYSLGQFISSNLIPVTLGNIVGGALCVGAAYSSVFGKLFGDK